MINRGPGVIALTLRPYSLFMKQRGIIVIEGALIVAGSVLGSAGGQLRCRGAVLQAM
jgi:hypothetical protein